jgi:hypothetical protein
MALQLLIAGGLLVVGLYHIGLFAFRRDLSVLFFGIACLLILFRTLFVGEILWIRFWPSFSWELGVKIEYLSVFLGIGFFVLYAHQLYKKDASRKVTFSLFGMICLMSMPVILFPARIYTHLMLYSQIVLLLSVAYIVIVVILATIRKRKGAWIN